MSEVKLRRRSRQVSITLTTATGSATTLRLDDFAGGVVDCGTMSTNATTLQVWAAAAEAGPYGRLRKVDGSAAEITLSPSTTERRVYALPDEVFAVPFMRVVSGTTNSTGTVCIVTLKS